METILVISSVLLWLAVLFILLLTLVLVRRMNAYQRLGQSNGQGGVGGLLEGQTAPDFTAQSLNGETVNLSTYAKRAVALLFFSTHCRPCKDLLPRIEPLGLKAAQVNVDIVLVSLDDIVDTRNFIDELDIHLPVLIAPRSTNSFAKDYQAVGTPSYCFINRQGKVQSAGYPSMDSGPWKALTDSWVSPDVAMIVERR